MLLDQSVLEGINGIRGNDGEVADYVFSLKVANTIRESDCSDPAVSLQIVFIPEQFTVKAQELLFISHVTVCCHVTVCIYSVQIAAIGGCHLASVTRCKTKKAVVKPFISLIRFTRMCSFL